MDFNDLRRYCLSKKCAYEDYPFGPEPLTIKVGSKMFAILSDDTKTSLSLKCDPFVAQSLREQYTSVKPGYHLNKEHWNTVFPDCTIPDSEILWMIDHSYDLVVKSLTKEEKKKPENKE
jgi:predicted DNA-binding protein (MmcQ/YjbR family)